MLRGWNSPANLLFPWNSVSCGFAKQDFGEWKQQIAAIALLPLRRWFWRRNQFGRKKLPPLVGLVILAQLFVQMHQRLHSLLKAVLIRRPNFGLTLFHAFVTLDQERLRFG